MQNLTPSARFGLVAGVIAMVVGLVWAGVRLHHEGWSETFAMEALIGVIGAVLGLAGAAWGLREARRRTR